MSKKNELTEKLKLLDSGYFSQSYSKVKPEYLISILATYLYDSDIHSGLDENHWDILCKIRDLFDDFIAWETIKCLCFGEHDT